MIRRSPAHSIREQKGLSLRTLAKACGLSITAIHQIEVGEHSPTVSSLQILATALNVPITAFFETHHEQTTVFVKHDCRQGSQGDGIVMESLGVGLPNQQLEPFFVSIDPGAGNGQEPITHSGEEFVYCVDGEVEYHVNGELYRLEGGDSLLFEASQPHSFFNASKAPATLIMIFQAVEGSQLAGPRHLER